MSLRDVIARRIEADGPLPFVEYMDLALYHPELGYYARADRRSGRTGDFFTSVDVGSLFGELIAEQLAEMWTLIRNRPTADRDRFDLVEAGAGNGRLALAVLDASRAHHPELYSSIRLQLVERSPMARASQAQTLGSHAAKLGEAGEDIPSHVNGVIFANELLDALPVHPVVMTGSGLREVYVDVDPATHGQLVERLGMPSAEVHDHIRRFGIHLEPGWRVEVSPAVVRWVEQASRCLDHGFLLLIDYGHAATELYSPTHAAGTLATYRHHVVEPLASHPAAPLPEPGATDITAHVDLTAVQSVAEATGLVTLAIIDQTYFLLGLGAAEPTGPVDSVAALKRQLALKTLLVPGGLGSTHKVLVFGKNVGSPRLRCRSFSSRST